MKTTDFQRLLLRAAVVAMAADGEVAPEERAQLARIASTTAYFLDFDYATALPALLADGANYGAVGAAGLAATLAAGALRPVQEDALLDVLLRVIEADAVIHPAERELLRTVRLALQLADGALLGRFPRLLRYLLPEETGSYGG